MISADAQIPATFQLKRRRFEPVLPGILAAECAVESNPPFGTCQAKFKCRWGHDLQIPDVAEGERPIMTVVCSSS